jgi:hypothetical protein
LPKRKVNLADRHSRANARRTAAVVRNSIGSQIDEGENSGIGEPRDSKRVKMLGHCLTTMPMPAGSARLNEWCAHFCISNNEQA